MLKSIQSLRGIFAFMIFLHHIAGFMAGGDCGVCFFIVLSGFVLCDGYQTKFQQHAISYSAFMKRRLFKIYPLHLLCLLFAFLLTFSSQHSPLVWTADFLLLQSWSPNPDIHFSGNSVSWFLSTILFCYAIFPILIAFLQKSLRCFFLFSIFLFLAYFIGIQYIPLDMSNNIIYINPIFRIPDFILGIILWQIIGEKVKSATANDNLISTCTKSIIEISTLAFFVMTVTIYPVVSQRYSVVSLWWPSIVTLIAVFSLFNRNGSIISKLLHFKPLTFFGNISFSFYMIHVLMIKATRILMQKFELDIPSAVYVFSTFILTTTAAYIIWRFFEKPLTQKLLSI